MSRIIEHALGLCHPTGPIGDTVFSSHRLVSGAAPGWAREPTTVAATARASFAMYNTFQEIDVLADAIVKTINMFK